MISARGLSACLAVLLSLALGESADASWQETDAGRGYTKAQSLSVAGTPSTSASGRNVTVAWAAPTGGAPADGYLVKRYDGANVEQAIGASCSGTITVLTCTEAAVPPGTWRYAITTARDNWRAAESAKSSAVTVAAPAMTLSTTTVNSFPTTLTGQLTTFSTGQSVTFRLDNPTTGPVLSGSIAPILVPTNGTANVSVTIPAGTSNGPHTVHAIGSGGDQASTAITVDAPTVTASAVAKSAGGNAAFIRQGGTYHVYANVAGTGSPPAGLASLTADVRTVTTGQTAAAMTLGTYTVAGTTYNYRSAQLTANGTLSAGSKAYSVRLTDAGGTATQSSFSVTVDNTAPTATDVQTTNVTGGTIGRAELGDRLTLTFSEQIDANSVLAGWSGAATNVTVRLVTGTADSVQIWNSANTAQLPLGSVSLAAADYTTANLTFGATGTRSTMTRSGSTVTITLGTQSAAATTAAANSNMIWTPSATATDRAGNPGSTTARTETGTADKNF